jgi:PAS domain S-box-containing protein
MHNVIPLNRTRHIPDHDLLITMADGEGTITYANAAFCQVHACQEKQLLRMPHNILRHPDMPATIFSLVWERLHEGREVFAYVKNLAMNGEYYWTLSHWTVNKDFIGRLGGYQCCRRAASPESVAMIEPLYRELRRIEAAAGNPDEAIAAGRQALDQKLAARGQGYDQFVLSCAVLDEVAA